MLPAEVGMAAEGETDLSKAQKRELKWERKQAKVKAVAEAAGQTYVPPSREEKEAATDKTDKMGKRKKRKLAALQETESPAGAATDTEPAAIKNTKSNKSSGSTPNGDSVLAPEQAGATSAEQIKAEKKAAKKAKKAANAGASIASAEVSTEAETPKLEKKNKNAGNKAASETTQPAANGAAPMDQSPAELPKKKSKKQKTGTSDNAPHGRITVRQEAVLASVGDKELAKSGNTIQKNLYHEHPDVTAMSPEEVAKHRADRDTAVTGADLRPVLQFDQAGEGSLTSAF